MENKNQVTSDSVLENIKDNIMTISVMVIIMATGVLFYILEWWEIIGLFILKFGLGIKIQGAKTFAVAVAKSGGKKALLLTTGGVLLKRHIIDITSKFFAEHSVTRYKSNIVSVLKIKFKHIRQSSPWQKAKAVGSTLLSIPLVYFFWTKVLGTAIQKFLYAMVIPLFSTLWGFLSTGLSFITNIITFVFQVTMMNYFIRWLESFRVGKLIIKYVFETIKMFTNILDFVNDTFKFIGIDPKHGLIMWSVRFNRWLENIILKEYNSHETLKMKRRTHFNCRERIALKRKAYKISKEKKVSFIKKTKNLFRKKVMKKKTWQEKREERKNKRMCDEKRYKKQKQKQKQ